MSIYAWHFTDGNFLRDGSPLPAVGEWLKYSGKIRICQTGYHFSRTPWDALKYAPGDTLHLVECDEIEDEHSDKGVCRRRRIIASMDAAEMLRYFARMQALSVIMDAPEMEDVVYSWLFSGDSAARSAARSAADSAAYSAAYSAVRSAAYSAAYSASRYAAHSAARYAAYSAADSAACSAADSAAYSAAHSAARYAAETEFNMLVWECFEGPMKEINWDGLS